MPNAPRRNAPDRQPRRRTSGTHYGRGWRRIREAVLRQAGIPREEWHRYAVDHRPPYNPDVEPNHWAYTLVPMLVEEHNRKTATEDQHLERDHRGRWKRTGGGFNHEKK